MKVHPEVAYQKLVPTDSTRGKAFLDEIDRGTRQDILDREGWVTAKEKYFRRRYCLEWRDPPFPWPGSSNIVMPLIDKKIDEIKPQYINIISASKPPVTVHAVDPESQKKVKNVELWFDWLVKVGSPNFIEEVVYAIDDCLETGRGVLSTYWHYETRKVPDVLERDRLPDRLRRLVVARDEKEANALHVMTGGATKALTRREFDSLEAQIRDTIYREFDLDPEEPMDQRAIDDVYNWLREGSREPLPFQKRDVILNVPAIGSISPIDFVVPAYTTDLERTERITEIGYMTEREVRAKAADHKFNSAAVKEMLDRRSAKRSGQSQRIQVQQAFQEGVTSNDNDLIEVWKTSCWIAPQPGAREQKCVLLRAADAPDLPLKLCLYDRPNGRWPYHGIGFEMNKKRWYSPRGVPEKLDDIDAEITAQHRAKLNRNSIVTSPTFKVRPNRGINWSSWRWQPGSALPCTHPDDVTAFDFKVIDGVFDNEMNQLRVWGEDYLGGSDYGITNPLSNTDDARTATEINAIQNKARQSLSMRGLLFTRPMAGVFQDLFDLWHRYGDPEVYIRVTGGSEPLKLTKEELQGRFLFQCTGTIGDTDPQAEAQKALARITILSEIKMNGLAEPKYEIDLGEAIQDWLEKDDIRVAKRIIRERTPEEIEAIQKQKAEMLAQQQQQELLTTMAGGKPQPQKNGASKPPPKPGSMTLGGQR